MGEFFLWLRINLITTIVVIKTNKQAAITGTITERIETAAEVTSSAILTGTMAVPPVATVTAGRIASDLTAWTLPEMSKPAIRARTGLTWAMLDALAAKTMAPAVGRTKLCTTSLIWLTAGILSASISMIERKINVPITHQEVMASHGELSLIRSVYFASSETTSRGIYAFNPALAESPNAEMMLKISILFF